MYSKLRAILAQSCAFMCTPSPLSHAPCLDFSGNAICNLCYASLLNQHVISLQLGCLKVIDEQSILKKHKVGLLQAEFF